MIESRLVMQADDKMLKNIVTRLSGLHEQESGVLIDTNEASSPRGQRAKGTTIGFPSATVSPRRNGYRGNENVCGARNSIRRKRISGCRGSGEAAGGRGAQIMHCYTVWLDWRGECQEIDAQIPQMHTNSQWEMLLVVSHILGEPRVNGWNGNRAGIERC